MIEKGKSMNHAFFAALAMAALALAGCAGGDGGSRADGRDSPGGVSSQPGQGALYGAGVGAALGCASVLLTDGDARDCLERAAIGGVIGAAAGAAGGYLVQQRDGSYAIAEQQLEQRLAAAEQELAEARRTRAAAEHMVGQHERDLARLSEAVEEGRASYVLLDRAVAHAREDARAVAEQNTVLKRQVAALEAETEALEGNDVAVPPELARVRDQLRLEQDRLERQLRILTEIATNAEEVG
jgi:hypothetical protein